jgi:hypothetical protein
VTSNVHKGKKKLKELLEQRKQPKELSAALSAAIFQAFEVDVQRSSSPALVERLQQFCLSDKVVLPANGTALASGSGHAGMIKLALSLFAAVAALAAIIGAFQFLPPAEPAAAPPPTPHVELNATIEFEGVENIHLQQNPHVARLEITSLSSDAADPQSTQLAWEIRTSEGTKLVSGTGAEASIANQALPLGDYFITWQITIEHPDTGIQPQVASVEREFWIS